MARDKNKSEEHDPTLGPAVAAVHVGGESLVDRLLPHAKKIGLTLLGAALLVTAVVGWRVIRRHKEERATKKVVAALDLVDRPVRYDDGLSMPPMPDEETFASEAEKTQAVADAMKQTGSARGVTALVEADVLLRGGKLDEALAIYRKHAKDTGLDGLLAREGVGITLEAQATATTDPTAKQKLLEDALAAFRAIQTDDKGPRRDVSLYHEGRLLEALGKPDEAKTALQKALAIAPDSPLAPMIKDRLSSLGGGA
ncbi:MAG TPA: tetratricopeptide repeat protein [Kofleriaceae bacterium]|nr:tetratricopeptide repeat protein [Kofleriaceae bacterium]